MDEGYIKFQLHWKEGQAPSHPELDQLISWRNRLFQLGLIGWYEDLRVAFGNVSLRTGNEGFIVSGTQTGHIERAEPEQFCVVEQSLLESNTVHCVGPVKASSESMTHAALYSCDPAIQVIFHVHHRAAWDRLLHQIPTTRPVPYGTPAMAKEVQRLYRESNLKEVKSLAMAGHEEGLITFGANADEAGEKLVELLAQELDQDSSRIS